MNKPLPGIINYNIPQIIIILGLVIINGKI